MASGALRGTRPSDPLAGPRADRPQQTEALVLAPVASVRKVPIVFARHTVPALTAGAATGLVLLLRRVSARSWRGGRRHGASAARPPWRRTPTGGQAAAPCPDSREPEDAGDAAVLVEEAEEHVHRYWNRLRAQQPPPDTG